MDIVERRNCMKNILLQNEDFIIIGLTGRTGSGCSDAADIFGSTYKELELPQITAGPNGFQSDEERDYRIIKRFASAHWLKFDIINSKTIISSFLLDEFDAFLSQINLKISKETNKSADKTKEGKDIKKQIYKIVKNSFENKKELNTIFDDDFEDEIKEIVTKLNSSEHCLKEITYKEFQNIVDWISNKYVDNDERLYRSRYINEIEEFISNISVKLSYKFICENEENFWDEIKNINEIINTSKCLHNKYCFKSDDKSEKDQIEDEGQNNRIIMFAFVHDIMPAVGKAIYKVLKDNKISYTKLYQKFGNSIRRYGKINWESPDDSQDDDGKEGTSKDNINVDIFAIPRRIARYIKALRHPFSDESKINRPVRVVIDSIKSVFEANYLRQRYSSFYLFAIASKDEIRRDRLIKKNLNYEEIQHIDWNEYSSEGFKIYEEYKRCGGNEKNCNLGKYELSFAQSVKDLKNENSIYFDDTRLYAYEHKLQQFYLQDVAASIENADAFIINNHNDNISKNMELRWAIVRNISLIMFPGLIMPTPIERCMQIAFAAKCNSGCLSRQVGAVVTDKDYNILSIGWNDVPCGDISCSRKNLVDLCRFEDQEAYSDYELLDYEFRKRIEKYNYNDTKLGQNLIGLPIRYCFKDIHIDGRNPMRSRAMHAEEKALATCGDKCKGGYLFTTSSPCEMCSKNVKNHHIKKIYYIELYPGISETQYSNTGDKTNRAEHILFSGAVGRAYMQMYTPIMPQKDILEALGIDDWFYDKK